MKKIGLAILFGVMQMGVSFAQCAMCKAQLETRVETSAGIGTGINAGVLYLMVVPYLLLIFIALMYRFKKKQKLNQVA